MKMEKTIISELNRMKSLMGLILEQGSADINIDRMAQDQLDNLPIDGKFKTLIGEGTKYPVMLPGFKTYVMSSPYKDSPPDVKQSGVGVTATDFIENVKVDENGNEYVNLGEKKYCLPNKEFWTLFSSGNYVYQINNPNNNMKFSMYLTTSAEVEVPVMNNNGQVIKKTIAGYEASLLCQGGDNGWSFLLKDGNVFWFNDGGTLKSYNFSNPEHFDIRSDFDIWWDEYSWTVEILIGLFAAWAGAGLAALFIETFEIGGILAASYAGGSETVLSVIMQSLVETGLMYPVIDYQFSRGIDDDAMLNMIFCFFPFLTELSSVQRFIKGGIQPETTSSLSTKVAKFGGFDAMKKSPAEYQKFMDGLSGSELMLWKATCEQFSTDAGAEEFKKSLKSYLKKNEDKVLSDILGKDNLRKPLDDLSGGLFSKTASTIIKSNPIKGTGVLAQFVRIGLPIFGAVVAFKKIYGVLQNLGYNEEQSEKIANELKNALENDPLAKKLAEIDQKLFEELSEKLLIDYVSDKSNTDNILSGLLTSPEITKDLNKKAIEGIMENPEYYKKYVGQGNIQEIKDWINQLNNYVKSEILNYLEEKGETNVVVTDIEPLKKYNYKTNKVPNGEILIKKQLSRPTDLSFNEPTDIEFKTI
jgi:hypothetical protein